MAVYGDVLFTRDTDKGSDQSDIWDDTALIDAYNRAISGAYKKIASRRKATASASDDFSESCSDAKPSEPETLAVRNKKRHQSDSKHKKTKWKIGDYCRAMYDADGLVYDCKIINLDLKNDSSIVEFVGYGNTQSVPVSELLVSERRRSVLKQMGRTENDIDGREYDESDGSRSKRRDSKRSKSKGTAKHSRYSPSGFMPPNLMGMPSGLTQSDVTDPQMAMPPPPPPSYFSNVGEAGEEDEALAAMLMSWYMSGYHTGYYQGLKQARSATRT